MGLNCLLQIQLLWMKNQQKLEEKSVPILKLKILIELCIFQIFYKIG